MFMGKYTTVGLKWHLHPRVIKTELNSKLSKLDDHPAGVSYLTSTVTIMPDVEEEISHAFGVILPSCEGRRMVPARSA